MRTAKVYLVYTNIFILCVFLLKLQARRNVFTARYFVLMYSDNLVNMEMCVERARNVAATRVACVYKTHKKPNLYILRARCSILTFRKKLFNEGFAPEYFQQIYCGFQTKLAQHSLNLSPKERFIDYPVYPRFLQE